MIPPDGVVPVGGCPFCHHVYPQAVMGDLASAAILSHKADVDQMVVGIRCLFCNADVGLLITGIRAARRDPNVMFSCGLLTHEEVSQLRADNPQSGFMTLDEYRRSTN
jgi:hypothetical protein